MALWYTTKRIMTMGEKSASCFCTRGINGSTKSSDVLIPTVKWKSPIDLVL